MMFDVLMQFIQKTKGASIKYALESFPTGYRMVSDSQFDSVEMIFFIKNWDRSVKIEDYLEECQRYWNLSFEIFPIRKNLRALKVQEVLKMVRSQLETTGVVEAAVKLSDLISHEFLRDLTSELSKSGLSYEISSDNTYMRVAV